MKELIHLNIKLYGGNMYTYTTVREIVESLNLEVLNEGNLDLKIDIPNIYQIGYELVGFLDKESDELNKYINIFFNIN